MNGMLNELVPLHRQSHIAGSEALVASSNSPINDRPSGSLPFAQPVKKSKSALSFAFLFKKMPSAASVSITSMFKTKTRIISRPLNKWMRQFPRALHATPTWYLTGVTYSSPTQPHILNHPSLRMSSNTSFALRYGSNTRKETSLKMRRTARWPRVQSILQRRCVCPVKCSRLFKEQP